MLVLSSGRKRDWICGRCNGEFLFSLAFPPRSGSNPAYHPESNQLISIFYLVAMHSSTQTNNLCDGVCCQVDWIYAWLWSSWSWIINSNSSISIHIDKNQPGGLLCFFSSFTEMWRQPKRLVLFRLLGNLFRPHGTHFFSALNRRGTRENRCSTRWRHFLFRCVEVWSEKQSAFNIRSKISSETLKKSSQHSAQVPGVSWWGKREASKVSFKLKVLKD